jgi:hypothetical protein
VTIRPEPPCLHFKLLNDVSHFKDAHVEEGRCLSFFKHLIFEKYHSGEFEIELHFAFRREPEKRGRLVISLWKNDAAWCQFQTKISLLGQIAKGNFADVANNGEGDFVLMGSSDPTKNFQGVIPPCPTIPSWVRLEAIDYWMEGQRDILASPCLQSLTVQIVGTVSKGEMSVVTNSASHKFGCSVGSLIESGPKISYDISEQAPELKGGRFEDDLNVLKDGILVSLFDHSCRVALQKDADLLIKLTQLVCRPRD